VVTALCDLGALDLPIDDRPRLAQRAENTYVGMPCGIMDQAAATLCRAWSTRCSSTAAHSPPTTFPSTLAGTGLAMLVVDTRAPHQLVDGEYAARRASCERAAALLDVPALRDVADLDAALAALPDGELRRRTRHVVTENARVLAVVDLLRAGRVRDIGPVLTASHASMRDDYEITVPEVDVAVDTAVSAGAYGARMTGGGFGGCVLALVDREATDTVATAVADACRRQRIPAAGVLPSRAVRRRRTGQLSARLTAPHSGRSSTTTPRGPITARARAAVWPPARVRCRWRRHPCPPPNRRGI